MMLTEAVEYINKFTNDYKPQIGIILGSGLGELADEYCEYSIPYSLNHDSPVFIVYIIQLFVYSPHTDDNWLFAFYI